MPTFELEIAPGELVTITETDRFVITVRDTSGGIEWVPDDDAQARRIAELVVGNEVVGPVHLRNPGDVIVRVTFKRASSWIARCANVNDHDGGDVFRSQPGTRQRAEAEADAHRTNSERCAVATEIRRVGG
jgi:hypothetical protein